jgi:hypothetical protein
MGLLALSYGLVALLLVMILLVPARRRSKAGRGLRLAPPAPRRQTGERRLASREGSPRGSRRPLLTAAEARRRWQPGLRRNRPK